MQTMLNATYISGSQMARLLWNPVANPQNQSIAPIRGETYWLFDW